MQNGLPVPTWDHPSLPALFCAGNLLAPPPVFWRQGGPINPDFAASPTTPNDSGCLPCPVPESSYVMVYGEVGADPVVCEGN